MRRLINVIIAISWAMAFFLYSGIAAAQDPVTCIHTSGGNWTATGDHSMQRDVPVGAVDPQQVVAPNTFDFRCNDDPNADRDVYLKIKTSTPPVSGYSDVYPTNLDGIGVRFHLAESSDFCKIKSSDVIAHGEANYTCHMLTIIKDPDGYFSENIGSAIEFVKIKPTMTSGVITQIPQVTISYEMNNTYAGGDMGIMWTSNANVKFDVLACTINTPKIDVWLPDVEANQFRAVGNTPAAKDFTVQLACEPGTHIVAELDGEKSSETSNQSVLALTNAGDSGVAKGIGIQILYNNNPLNIGSPITLTTSQTDMLTLPFVARYFQTQSEISVGQADSTATLNITYQ